MKVTFASAVVVVKAILKLLDAIFEEYADVESVCDVI
jgi:hypothetical protein